MENIYDISNNGKVVGSAEVIPDGLYCRISCRCAREKGIARVIAKCGLREENIGVCIPDGDILRVVVRVPKRRLEGLTGFILQTQGSGEWFSCKCDEPICFLQRIIDARFAQKDGQPGVVIPDDITDGR